MPGAPPAGQTYYEARRGVPPRPRPALEGPAEAGTVVVGGGLAGLGAALSLAERGDRGDGPVLLVEARRVGDGASGRNGGMASAGFARDAAWLEARVGAAGARALLRLSREAGLDLLRRRIERHAIPCGPVPGVVVASWFDDPAGLRAEAARHNAAHGTRLEFWPRERLRELYRSPRYHDGLLDPDGLHLDPLALCDGLARAAEALGVRILEDTPALGLRRLGSSSGGFELATPGGTVRARRVVLCQSAERPALLPRLARAALPVATYIVVTEPLGARAADAVRAPHAVYDDRFATGYYRLLDDGRLLWGGRISLREEPPAVLVPRMRRDLALVYPQLADARIDYAWSGRMGFARHRMPLVRELEPGLWAAGLFGGHGLNTATMAGELVARAIDEGDPAWRLFEPFGPAWVGGPLGRLAAQALFHGHAARDSLRAAWHRRRNAGKEAPVGGEPTGAEDQGG